MSKVNKPYIVLDEDILDDPKIEELISNEGIAGLGFYIGILTVMRRYEDTDFMIPFSKISGISKKYFNTSEKRLLKIVNTMIEIGLFSQHQNALGERMFFSPRRQKDLFKQKELRHKQSDAADETNKKLGRGKYKTV